MANQKLHNYYNNCQAFGANAKNTETLIAINTLFGMNFGPGLPRTSVCSI